jgi:phosphate transport system protein
MRTEFHAQLASLTSELGEMCGIAASAAADATAAVVDFDPTALDRVRARLGRLDALNAQVDRRAFAVLALHAPVAHDLRVTMSSFVIAANADRMGALAANIAKVGTRRDAANPVPAVTLPMFAEMGRHAVMLAERTQAAVLDDDIDEARRVQDGDAAMNDLHRTLLTSVARESWPYGVAAASDVVLLGRFYERFADNAVDIARKVIFQASGQLSLADPA